MLPTIGLRTQPAQLGIDADPGTWEMRQPKAAFELRQIPAKLSIEQPRGELDIDQSRAWDALARTPILEVMNRIYSETRSIVLQGIAKRVEEGNALAQIHLKGYNPIAERGKDISVTFPEFAYPAPASVDNVDMHYVAHTPRIDVEQGGVQLQTRPNPPELTFHRGKLQMEMIHYGSVEVIPPQLDLSV